MKISDSMTWVLDIFFGQLCLPLLLVLQEHVSGYVLNPVDDERYLAIGAEDWRVGGCPVALDISSALALGALDVVFEDWHHLGSTVADDAFQRCP